MNNSLKSSMSINNSSRDQYAKYFANRNGGRFDRGVQSPQNVKTIYSSRPSIQGTSIFVPIEHNGVNAGSAGNAHVRTGNGTFSVRSMGG